MIRDKWAKCQYGFAAYKEELLAEVARVDGELKKMKGLDNAREGK